MSEQTPRSTLEGSFVVDQEWVDLADMAARKMDRLFERYELPQTIDLPGHETMKFYQQNDIEVIVYEHDAKPNFVAETPEDHEMVRTLFVHSPGQTVDCYFDSLADERSLLEEGNFEALVALRAQKKLALVDPNNHSPLEKDEALELSRLLRSAESVLSHAA